MSWDIDTAQARIRLCARKSIDSHSRQEIPVSCIVCKYGGRVSPTATACFGWPASCWPTANCRR